LSFECEIDVFSIPLETSTMDQTSTDIVPQRLPESAEHCRNKRWAAD
jgi:hypothetical protein